MGWRDYTGGGLTAAGSEVSANLPGEVIVDLGVTRHAGSLAGRTIDLDGLVAALSKQLATVRFEMADGRAPFHAPTLSDSRITSPPPAASAMSSRLASSTIATASWRLARASSRVAPWVLAGQPAARQSFFSNAGQLSRT